MKNYKNRTWDFGDPAVVSTYDELPLWSAKPGFLLLDNIDYATCGKIIDIGFGAGFPLLEIAERFGDASRVYGVDPWIAANERVEEKILQYGITNVELIAQSACSMPFATDEVDLITSNLGINNFDEKEPILRECFRVLKPNGKLALTSNFKGHFDQFYRIFKSVLRSFGLSAKLEDLQRHEQSRGTPESLKKRLLEIGFQVEAEVHETYDLKFSSGAAFLRHHFINAGFFDAWKKIASTNLDALFDKIESDIDALALNEGGFSVSVPIGFIQVTKPQTEPNVSDKANKPRV